VAIGVLALAVAVAAAVAVVPAARSRTLETVRTGLGVREPIIAFGLSLAADHPLTGVGPGLFGSYYAREALDGWSWRGQPLPKVGMPWVHCLPVEVACEYGLVGVCAFGGVAAAAVRRAWIAARAGDPMGRGALGMLAAFLLIGLVDLTFIKDWVRCEAWVAAGVAFGLGASGGRPAVGGGDRRPMAS
jgi:O-antigen ligase